LIYHRKGTALFDVINDIYQVVNIYLIKGYSSLFGIQKRRFIVIVCATCVRRVSDIITCFIALTSHTSRV